MTPEARHKFTNGLAFSYVKNKMEMQHIQKWKFLEGNLVWRSPGNCEPQNKNMLHLCVKAYLRHSS